jgi:hypothetical protein
VAALAVCEQAGIIPGEEARSMAGRVDHAAFIALLKDQFPEVAADIDECSAGLLHLEMGTLARATQAAISAEDVPLVRKHFKFIDEVYRQSTPEVENAVNVSYLECIGFDGRHARRIQARELLSQQLQTALRELEDYLAQIHGSKAKKT